MLASLPTGLVLLPAPSRQSRLFSRLTLRSGPGFWHRRCPPSRQLFLHLDGRRKQPGHFLLLPKDLQECGWLLAVAYLVPRKGVPGTFHSHVSIPLFSAAHLHPNVSIRLAGIVSMRRLKFAMSESLFLFFCSILTSPATGHCPQLLFSPKGPNLFHVDPLSVSGLPLRPPFPSSSLLLRVRQQGTFPNFAPRFRRILGPSTICQK